MRPVDRSGTVACPWAGAAATATLDRFRPTSDASLSSTSTYTAAPWFVWATSALAFGLAGWPPTTAFTVTVTAAGADVLPDSSLTVYVNVSVPVNPDFGVYTSWPNCRSTVTVPLAGWPATATVVGSSWTLSASLARTTTPT